MSARYLKERKIKLEDADFESFGLAFADGRLTNAGALFADDCQLYHSRVFCTRWNGCDMAAGVMDAKDNQEYSGGILSMLKYAEDFVRVTEGPFEGVVGRVARVARQNRVVVYIEGLQAGLTTAYIPPYFLEKVNR